MNLQLRSTSLNTCAHTILLIAERPTLNYRHRTSPESIHKGEQDHQDRDVSTSGFCTLYIGASEFL